MKKKLIILIKKMKIKKLLLCVLLLFMPNFIKILLLRLSGAKIGKKVKIGFSIVIAKNLILEDFTRIGHFNLIWRLNNLTLKRGSVIFFGNWITGARSGSFLLGANSGITRFHFFESSGNISIGSNSIVAGRSSVFYCHGLTPRSLNFVDHIKIGDWCYIGSNSKFSPGGSIGNNTFVAMAGLVSKNFTNESYILLGGIPVKKIKSYNSNSVYWQRPYLSQAHHPRDYDKMKS